MYAVDSQFVTTDVRDCNPVRLALASKRNDVRIHLNVLTSKVLASRHVFIDDASWYKFVHKSLSNKDYYYGYYTALGCCDKYIHHGSQRYFNVMSPVIL